jgi:hypothetical protein
MSDAIFSIRAHFDGKVIVPEEPINLPVNAALEINVRPRRPSTQADELTTKRRLTALERFVEQGTHGVSIPDEMLRREHLYGDNGR